MAYLSLGPVSVAVYAVLNVAGMTALVGARIYDAVPQAPTFPFVFYEVRERPIHTLGGGGGVPAIELRVHAFSQYEGMKEAQSIIQKAVELLRDQRLSVTGYAAAGTIFYDETVSLGNEVINGVACRELVAMFRLHVTES